jgi:hypothetical protein
MEDGNYSGFVLHLHFYSTQKYQKFQKYFAKIIKNVTVISDSDTGPRLLAKLVHDILSE